MTRRCKDCIKVDVYTVMHKVSWYDAHLEYEQTG